ncbi:MAG: HD domain-containing protein [Planctomycetes bacterium]|nr:HD domain-containing protein [Planctomycetota bacterium]
MPKNFHEVRDPIHVFVKLDSDERKVLDSAPFQRLRHVHQLALTYLIYPGATHKRFEHSLGVMELATRIYDVVANPENLTDDIKNTLAELGSPEKRAYWRRVLRMAALCHDMGHLPFSHAAEELLPAGTNHEAISAAIIRSPMMQSMWNDLTPPLRTEDVVKIAIGPKEAKDLKFTTWETLVAEMIVGDSFGADRMDYLLRDSYHAGVPYGHFDHYRLIDTLRILPPPPRDEKANAMAPELGVELGGIRSAEAMMLARYFMYSQLYFHAIRRIYNVHLIDFLRLWLHGGKFDTSAEAHLAMTDNEVSAAIARAARSPADPAHDPARRIAHRDHFRLVYERNPDDIKKNPNAGAAVFAFLSKEMGAEHVRHEYQPSKGGAADFPVRMHDNKVYSSLALSETLAKLPSPVVDFVYADQKMAGKARQLITDQRDRILEITEEQDDHA